MKLTPAQRKYLKSAATSKLGVVAPSSLAYRTYGNASFHRCMKGLCERGIVKPYVHGGYEITDDGRKVLDETDGKRRERQNQDRRNFGKVTK